MREIGKDSRIGGGELAARHIGRRVQIALIGQKRVAGDPALGRHHFEKTINQVRVV